MTTTDIHLTPGQLMVLLNSTVGPDKGTTRHKLLSNALHHARVKGSAWTAAMTDDDISVALSLLEDYQREQRSPSAATFLRLFVRENPAVQQVYEREREQREVPADVPSTERST